ncbi:hypothetical protein M0804_003910 [Polistes exclamans]|nr:hypothetical protein M0804_003910 [Polistes exclamans]
MIGNGDDNREQNVLGKGSEGIPLTNKNKTDLDHDCDRGGELIGPQRSIHLFGNLKFKNYLAGRLKCGVALTAYG